MCVKQDGRDAIVNGGAPGTGRAIALRHAQEGSSIAIVDINEESGSPSAAEIGGTFLRCDIADAAEVRSAVTRVVDRFGGIEILITAAVDTDTGSHDDAVETPEHVWRRGLAVSQVGGFHCPNQAVPTMVYRGSGATVHLASVEDMARSTRHPVSVPAKSDLFGPTRSTAIDGGRVSQAGT